MPGSKEIQKEAERISLKSCFKARIVVMASAFPGFGKFSSFLPVAYSKPPIIVSES